MADESTSLDIMQELSNGVLTRVPAKSEIMKNVDAIIGFVNDGEINPIDVALAAKSLAETAAYLRQAMRDETELIDEVDKLTPRGTEVYYKGAKLKVQEAGVRYNFDDCNDPELEEINAELDEINLKVAEINKRRTLREKTLKSLNAAMTIVDEDTGDIRKVYPPKKRSTTTLYITLPKSEEDYQITEGNG